MGRGKLYALERIRRCMSEGRMVATNLDLFVEKIVNPANTVRAWRLPDHPGYEDLLALPLGNPEPTNDRMNGLLVLDEASTFLNSREWNEDKKGRLKIIGWLAQSRKFGWDLIVIVQHANMLDSQIREALFEHVGVCSNLQGMIIPGLTRFSGGWVRFPKVHRVAVRIGFHPKAPLVEHDFFRGEGLYACYNTLQVINPVVGIPSGCGYQFLSAYDLVGRYLSWWMRMRKIILSVAAFGFALGFLSCFAWQYFKSAPAAPVAEAPSLPPLPEKRFEDLSIYGVYQKDGRTHVILPGRDAMAVSAKVYADGRREYEVSPGVWVRTGGISGVVKKGGLQ